MEISTMEMVGRVLLAAALAAVIGIERELGAQPAGFRTHLLVSLGAAQFTVAGADVADAELVWALEAEGYLFLRYRFPPPTPGTAG